MSEHSSAVFNHSCLKVPINPNNKLPAPNYEQKYINQIKNQSLKDIESDSARMKTNKETSTKYKAFIDFYDSIPDYSDVNHLSNKEFYRKLESLKAKQKCYYDYLDTELNIEHKSDNFMDEYKSEASGRKSSRNSPNQPKNTPKTLHKSIISQRGSPDSEDSLSSCKEIVPAPPSRRSVRIESPKSLSSSHSPNFSSSQFHSPIQKSWKRNIGSAESKYSESSKFISSLIDSVDEDKDFCDEILKDNEDILKDHEDMLKDKDSVGTRSLPSSPTKNRSSIVWNDCGITIPKPFKMTVR